MILRNYVVPIALALAGTALVASSAFSARLDVFASQSTGAPSEGWTLHVDAKGHFPGDPSRIAHHWCKPVAGELIECQLYESDDPDARLVGGEMIVNTGTFNSYSGEEQPHWHYHRDELPVVEATLPDLEPDEAAQVVESLQETYGKVYLFWDPAVYDQPIGDPSVVVIDGLASATLQKP